MSELFTVMGKLILDKGNFDSDVKEADQSGKTLADNLSSYMNKVKNVIAAIGIGVAVKKAAQAVWNLANETAAAGDRIDKTSQSLGMSRQAFQEWDYILSQSGASIDSLGMTMRTMAEVISSNSAEAAAALSKLGLSAAQLSSMTPEQQFEALVRAFQQMPPSADKSQLALQIFGRSAQQLMPLLNSAAGSIDELKKRAEELGIIMSDEDVDAAVAFGDALDDLKRAWTSFTFKIGGQLLPGFTKAFQGIASSIGRMSTALVGAFKSGDWELFFATLTTEIGSAIPSLVDNVINIITGIFANADKFVSLAVAIVNGLIVGITDALPILVAKLPDMINTIWNGLSGSIEGLANLIIGMLNEFLGTDIPELDLSGITNAFQWLVDNQQTIISAVGAILAAFVTAKIANFVSSLSPLKIAFVAVAAAITLVATHWKDIKDWIGKAWETTVKWVEENFPELHKCFVEAGKWIEHHYNVFVNWVTTNWPELSEKLGEASGWLGKVIDVVIKFERKGWGLISDAFNKVIKWRVDTEKAIITFVRKKWDDIVNAFNQLGPWCEKAWKATVTFARLSWDALKKGFDNLKDWTTKSWEATVTFVQKAWDELKPHLDDVKKWAEEAWDVTINWIVGTVDKFIETVKGWFERSPQANIDLIVGAIDDWLKRIKDWIDGVDVKAEFETAVKTVDEWLKRIKDWLDGIGVTATFDAAIGTVDDWLKRIKEWLDGIGVTATFNAVTGTVDDWLNTIKGWLDKAGVTATFSLAVNHVAQWLQRIKDWISKTKEVTLDILSGTIDDWTSKINGWIDSGVSVIISFGGKLMGWAQTVWDWIQHGVNVGINFLGSLFGGGGGGTPSPSTFTVDGQTFSDPMGVFKNGSNAKGLNYVPFDGFAYLHRGETVLNQAKGREYRQNGGNGFDVGQLYSAVASAVASAVEEIQINMNGDAVGNAVTSRVSRNMYRKQSSRRFATV